MTALVSKVPASMNVPITSTPVSASLNYGPSDFDARQRLSAGYVYTVPVYHSSNYLLREALSGWQIAGHHGCSDG